MVDNTYTILQSGIKCFEKTEYVKWLESVLRAKGVCLLRRKAAIQHLKKTQAKNYCSSTKQNLCFFSNYIESNTFYTEYCKNIGGELSLSAFQDDFPDVFCVLQSGESIIVKFRVDYASFIKNTKECVCKQLFKWASAKCLAQGEQIMDFDGEIEKSIIPEHIIEIIPV